MSLIDGFRVVFYREYYQISVVKHHFFVKTEKIYNYTINFPVFLVSIKRIVYNK